MGGKASAPDAPDFMDYANAANISRIVNRENLQDQLRANRPTQITPGGTSTWTQDGDQWTQTITLPPAVQAALEQQQQLGLGRSELANEMLGQAGEYLTGPFGWDPMAANDVAASADARDAAEQAVYERATSRLDPYWEQQTSRQENQLWNQGLRPGDEAWDTAMGNLGRARTDAYQSAMNEAIMAGGREAERDFGMDMARRQQAITEGLRQRTQGLNELNTLMTGQQVGMPSFPTFTRAGLAQTPDYPGFLQTTYQGDLDQYNANQAQSQGLWSGVGQLAGTAIPMFAPGGQFYPQGGYGNLFFGGGGGMP